MTIRLTTVALGLVLLAGCAPKKLMLGEQFFPGQAKTMRESIKTVGGDKDATLNNYYIQICDVEAGKSSNCRTNLVLENIIDYDVNTHTGGF